MSQFITELLYAEKQACIPGLGTFTAARQKGKKPAFFPFLKGMDFSEKYDAADKQLAQKIAENRQINLNMAGYEVDKFVIRIKQELSRNGSFEFPSVGKLSADKSGKLRFETLSNDKALFGLSPIAPRPVEHENMVEVITKKIGLKNVGKNNFRIVWAVLGGLIILALVLLLLVRLNIMQLF